MTSSTAYAGAPCGGSTPCTVTANSPASPIVATFTWQPASGQTSATDPPPPAVIVEQDCTASWSANEVDGTAQPSGTADCNNSRLQPARGFRQHDHQRQRDDNRREQQRDAVYVGVISGRQLLAPGAGGRVVSADGVVHDLVGNVGCGQRQRGRELSCASLPRHR